jgi:Flp pilus assembly protein TadB
VSESGDDRREATALWTTVVAMCAVCCAGPLLAVLTAVGLTAGVAALFIPALAVVAVTAGSAVWWLRRRRSRRTALTRQSPGRVVFAVPAVRRYGAVDSVVGHPAAEQQKVGGST